jgi:hypothetical protein
VRACALAPDRATAAAANARRLPTAGRFANLKNLRSPPARASGTLNALPAMSKSYQCTCDDPRARLTGEPCPVHPWRRGKPTDDDPGGAARVRGPNHPRLPKRPSPLEEHQPLPEPGDA